MNYLRLSILVMCTTCWHNARAAETRKLSWKYESLDEPSGLFPMDKDDILKYLSKWNNTLSIKNNIHSIEKSQRTKLEERISEDRFEQNTIPDSITEEKWQSVENYKFSKPETPAENIFYASTNDSSMILSDMTKCLTNYKLINCMKMFVLIKLKRVVVELESPTSRGIDYRFLNGLVNFKWLNESVDESSQFRGTSLSKELDYYLHRMFKSRSLQVALFPGLGVELTPKSRSTNGNLCFSAKLLTQSSFTSLDGAVEEMRKKTDDKNNSKKKKKKKNSIFSMMPPMSAIPQLIMMGMMPFALANLKSMVMNAFMVNSMALNSAIFMTIRNLVFGPRKGEKVKYVNYGYNKKPVEKKPTLVLHSPAAFVTKPKKQYPPYQPPSVNYNDNPNSYQVSVTKNNRRKIVQNKPNNHIDYPPYIPHAVNSLQPNYEQSQQVDAPISYLNNNQYLQPSHDSTQITKSQSFSYDLQDPKIKYESSHDQYSPINRGSSRIDVQPKNSYSSKYNDDEYDDVSDTNYYANHRPNS